MGHTVALALFLPTLNKKIYSTHHNLMYLESLLFIIEQQLCPKVTLCPFSCAS